MRRQNHRAAGAAAVVGIVLAAIVLAAFGACTNLRGSAQPAVAGAAAEPGGLVAPLGGDADPCWDFASYACGAERGNGSRLAPRAGNMLDQRQPNIERFIRELGAGKVRADDRETVVLRDYYARCTDTNARERSLPELLVQLAEIARAATIDDLARVLGRLRAVGFSILVDVHPVARSGTEDGSWDAAVGMGGPLVSRLDYSRSRVFVARYQQHMRNLAKLTDAMLGPEADAAFRIDVAVARLEPDPAASGAEPSDAEPPPLASAGRTAFPWRAYLSAAGVPVTVPVVVARPRDLERVDYLARLPLEDLKSYARIALLNAEELYLGPSFIRDHVSMLRGQAGPSGELSYDMFCPNLIKHTLEPLLADAYLSFLVDAPSEATARRMFEALRMRMINAVKGASWMDEVTRRHGVAALVNVQLRLIDDLEAHAPDDASRPAQSFLGLELAIRRSGVAAHLGGKGFPLEPSFEPAFYNWAANAIWVSPEMVRAPYVRTGAFNALTFGALGALIGHELGHTLEVATNHARATCVDDWIGDGFLADERFADLAGVEQALAEMEAELGKQGDRSRWRQEFFLAFAQQLCTFESEFHSEQDPHPPLSLRINRTLAHVRAFAETYQCSAGTPLGSAEPCTVW